MKIQAKNSIKVHTKENMIKLATADSIKAKSQQRKAAIFKGDKSAEAEQIHSSRYVVNGLTEEEIKTVLTKKELKTYNNLSTREKTNFVRKLAESRDSKKILSYKDELKRIEQAKETKVKVEASKQKNTTTNSNVKVKNLTDNNTQERVAKATKGLKVTKGKLLKKAASSIKNIGTKADISKENAIQSSEEKPTTNAQKTIVSVLGSIISIAGAVLLPLILFIVLLVVIVSVVVMVLGMIVWCFTPHSNLRNAYPLVGNEVLRWEYIVEDYSEKNHLSEEYIVYLLAIIAQESAGEGPDVMGIERYEEVDVISVQDSIDRGIKRFQKCVAASRFYDCDVKTAIQAYSYGEDFCKYVGERGKVFNQELSDEYAREKSNGELIDSSDEYIKNNHGGKIYNYGNQYYFQCVKQFYEMSFDDEMYKEIEKYFKEFAGLPYVSGGSDPSMGGFDCSGLVYYIYGQVGVHIPRLEKDQFEFSKEIKKEELRPGDLVFFKNETSNGEIGHVAIYIGNGKTFEAGDPVGEYDFNDSWHTENYLCAGRVLFTEEEKLEDDSNKKEEKKD